MKALDFLNIKNTIDAVEKAMNKLAKKVKSEKDLNKLIKDEVLDIKEQVVGSFVIRVIKKNVNGVKMLNVEFEKRDKAKKEKTKKEEKAKKETKKVKETKKETKKEEKAKKETKKEAKKTEKTKKETKKTEKVKKEAKKTKKEAKEKTNKKKEVKVEDLLE